MHAYIYIYIHAAVPRHALNKTSRSVHTHGIYIYKYIIHTQTHRDMQRHTMHPSVLQYVGDFDRLLFRGVLRFEEPVPGLLCGKVDLEVSGELRSAVELLLVGVKSLRFSTGLLVRLLLDSGLLAWLLLGSGLLAWLLLDSSLLARLLLGSGLFAWLLDSSLLAWLLLDSGLLPLVSSGFGSNLLLFSFGLSGTGSLASCTG